MKDLRDARTSDRRTPIYELSAREAPSGVEFGVVLDVTDSGTRVGTNEDFLPGTVHHLRIELPLDLDPEGHVDLEARCAWVKPGEGLYEHWVGFEFTSVLEPPKARALAALVRTRTL